MPARISQHRIRTALRIARPFGLAVAVSGLLVLCGYAAGLESLYRPLPGGPATHPLTALTAVWLGLALALRSRRLAPLLNGMAALALGVAAMRLFETTTGADLLSGITPFHDTVLSERAQGRSLAMGWNTAAMFLLVSAAVLSRRLPALSQVFASAAFALPLISVTGYAYGIEGFYGQMSLITVCLGVPLTLAALLMKAHRGVVRAVLSPYIGGRVARAQIVVGYVGPFFIGFVTLSVTSDEVHGLYGLFVVLNSAFITWMVVISAVLQDHIDRRRRAAERRLQFAAGHDGLTGLLNRSAFVERAQQERAHALRTRLPFALLMLDADHFKRINDRAGHAAGDSVLQGIAAVLRAQVRGSDIAARFGGEEFLVLLPETDLEQAQVLAERIRSGVQALRFTNLPAEVATVTISIGCTSSSGEECIDTAVSRADAALYEAKGSGRNRTVVRSSENVIAAA